MQSSCNSFAENCEMSGIFLKMFFFYNRFWSLTKQVLSDIVILLQSIFVVVKKCILWHELILIHVLYFVVYFYYSQVFFTL